MKDTTWRNAVRRFSTGARWTVSRTTILPSTSWSVADPPCTRGRGSGPSGKVTQAHPRPTVAAAPEGDARAVRELFDHRPE